MNYYTIVTPDKGLPCTLDEAMEIQAILDKATDDENAHGFEFQYHDGEGCLTAEEVGTVDALPEDALNKIGALIAQQGWPYLEHGMAFTAGDTVPGAFGGGAFRILPDGSIIMRQHYWMMPDGREDET